jgi:hypothetical protein
LSDSDSALPLPSGSSPIRISGSPGAIKPITVSINPDRVLKNTPTAKTEKADEPAHEELSVEEAKQLIPLSSALSDYVQGLSGQKKHNLHTIWHGCPYRVEGQFINITVTNKIQESLLLQEKQDMLELLRGLTGEKNLDLLVSLELPPEQAGVKYMTNKERFDKMAEQNPLLGQLQELLGFDVDTPI